MWIRDARLEELRRLESNMLDAQFKTAVQEELNCLPFESEAVLYPRPVDYYRGRPEALLAGRRRKLQTARELRKQENNKLRQQAATTPDPLDGGPNRVLFGGHDCLTLIETNHHANRRQLRRRLQE